MKKIIFLLLLLLIGLNTFGTGKKNNDNTNNDLVTKENLIELNDKLEKRIIDNEKINLNTLESISKQLEAASYNLSVFGILFGIGAICLGIYVTYVERKIVKISDENKELLNKNQLIKKEVQDLNTLIQNDINGLYLKIKREETNHIIERLIIVPKDITNVLQTLFSRELKKEDFEKFKIAYNKLESKDNNYKEKFHFIFFQHFLYDSMKDELIRKDIKNFLEVGIRCSFENDILKSSSDFILATIDLGIDNFKEEITLFFKGLSESIYVDYDEIYKTTFEKLNSRENKFKLFNLIESNSKTRKSKIKIGELLKKSYESNTFSESEKLVIEELEQLILEQKKKEEEEKKKIEEQKRKEEERKKLIENKSKKK
jgi:hypothetical protein